MDEISRDQPDPSAPRTHRDRSKGPEELLVFERGQIADDLVVNDGRAGSRGAGSRGDGTGDPGREDAVPSEREETVRRGRRKAARAAPADDGPAAGSAPEAQAPEEGVDPALAAAAIAAGEDVAEIEADLAVGEDEEEGLPAVPELADAAAVAKVVFVLMMTSREGLSLLRLAQACNTTQKLVEEALAVLQADLHRIGLPVELARAGDTVKWVSGQEMFPYLQRLRGVKRLEKLSAAAL